MKIFKNLSLSLSLSLLLTASLLLVSSCVVEEVEPLEKEAVVDEPPKDSQATSKDWRAFRVLDADRLISFDFASSSQNSRTGGISTFAGMVDTHRGLMTLGSYGEIYSFPILSSTHERNSLWNLVLTIDKEDNRNWHVREYRNHTLNHGKSSFENFSGQVLIYDLSGNILLELDNQQEGFNKSTGKSSNTRVDTALNGDCYFIYFDEVCYEVGGTQRRTDGGIDCTYEPFIVTYDCSLHPPGSSGGGGSQGSGDGGSTGPGGGYNPPNQAVPISQPNPMTTFFNSLAQQAQGWLQSNPQVYGMVEDFVMRNGANSLKASDLQFFIEEISGLGLLDQAGLHAFAFALLNADAHYPTYSTAFYESADSFFPFDLTNPFTAFQFSQSIAVRTFILKHQNPSWSQLRALWEASRETIQFGLDVAGLVPILGEVADLTNGVIYALYGDGVNATLSFASAVPVVGWASAGVKLAVMRVPKALGGYTTLKWIKNADGSLSFGDGSQLRQVLGITNSNVHAHHIIPQELANHPIVQQAAKSQHAFHMNRAENGIPIPLSNHLNGHRSYNDKLAEILDDIGRNNPSPDEAFSEISNLMNEIRAIIQQFPDKNLGEISNLIN